MQPTDALQSFIEACEHEHVSLEWLATVFGRAIAALGFRYFACVSHVDPLHPPPNAIVIHNYPAAWVRRFSDERLYAIDPVLQRAERENQPFFWDRVFPDALTPTQRALLADAAALGIAHGFTFPIQQTPGLRAPRTSCSIVPGGARVAPDRYLAVEGMALHLVAAINRLLTPYREEKTAALSHRERQCVLLIAQGKTDGEIAGLLGMAQSTAHTYIERLKLRLGVKTRTAAVARALIEGQICLGELTAPDRW